MYLVTSFVTTKNISVFQQYPADICNRRKELLPQLHALRREARTRLVMDTLFVGNRLVNQPSQPRIPQHNIQQINQVCDPIQDIQLWRVRYHSSIHLNLESHACNSVNLCSATDDIRIVCINVHICGLK
jgi:hypothetical protein